MPTPPVVRAFVAAGVMAGLAVPAAADDLSNQSFKIQYDAQGIRSLKRTSDVHDTDYIQAGGALGRLLIRFRTTANGDWRELREMTLDAAGHRRGSRQLHARHAAAHAGGEEHAERGGRRRRVARVERRAGPGGGGRGRARRRPWRWPGAAAAANLPVFTWSGARGETQWVQYTLPDRSEISTRRGLLGQRTGQRRDAGATAAPHSWRVLYQDGNEWKPVDAKGPYGVEANTFSSVEFAPVRTMALRLEATMAKDATVGLAEWRVGADAPIVAADGSERHSDVRARRRRARVDDHARQHRDAAARDRRPRGAVQLRRAHRRPRRHLHAQAAAAFIRRRATAPGSTGSAATAPARTS